MTLHEIGINTPLHVLMRREDCRAILLRMIPGIEEMLRVNPMLLLASVKLLHDSAPQFVTEEMVDAMAKELEPFD